MTPTVFAASFDPWVNANAPDATHSDPRNGTTIDRAPNGVAQQPREERQLELVI